MAFYPPGHLVALRKESVDRNSTEPANFRVSTTSLSARRAWIEIRITPTPSRLMRSLSARRAWIEIVLVCRKPSRFVRVALRKESVDRNKTANRLCKNRSWSLSARRAWIEIWLGVWIVPAPTWSLSARRAWIEIVWRGSVGLSRPVALRKESVDRNLCHPGLGYIGSVALRKESVDRNVG